MPDLTPPSSGEREPLAFACPRKSRSKSPKTQGKSKVQRAVELYDRRVNKNQSSASPKQESKPVSSSEEQEPYVYYTNGPRGLVELPEGPPPLVQKYIPGRTEEYQIVRVYKQDGIDRCVCDDCAMVLNPRVFEGSRPVARIGCSICGVKNAIADEATLSIWLKLGRPSVSYDEPYRGA